MNELNATCAICGTKYHVCRSCADETKIKPWRSIVDTISHYNIFLIIKDYTNKVITKSDAKTELEKCDLSEIDNFVPEIKSVITDIMKEDKKSSTKKIVSKKETDIESDVSDIE